MSALFLFLLLLSDVCWLSLISLFILHDVGIGSWIKLPSRNDSSICVNIINQWNRLRSILKIDFSSSLMCQIENSCWHYVGNLTRKKTELDLKRNHSPMVCRDLFLRNCWRNALKCYNDAVNEIKEKRKFCFQFNCWFFRLTLTLNRIVCVCWYFHCVCIHNAYTKFQAIAYIYYYSSDFHGKTKHNNCCAFEKQLSTSFGENVQQLKS